MICEYLCFWLSVAPAHPGFATLTASAKHKMWPKNLPWKKKSPVVHSRLDIIHLPVAHFLSTLFITSIRTSAHSLHPHRSHFSTFRFSRKGRPHGVNNRLPPYDFEIRQFTSPWVPLAAAHLTIPVTLKSVPSENCRRLVSKSVFTSLSPIVKGPWAGLAGFTPRVQSVVCRIGVKPLASTSPRLKVPFVEVQELYRLAHSRQFAGAMFGDSAKVDGPHVDWVLPDGCQDMPVELAMTCAIGSAQPKLARQRATVRAYSLRAIFPIRRSPRE